MLIIEYSGVLSETLRNNLCFIKQRYSYFLTKILTCIYVTMLNVVTDYFVKVTILGPTGP